MCQACGSDDVFIDGDAAQMICEACKEEAWAEEDAYQADSWRVGIDDYGVEEIEEVIYE